MLNQNRHYWTPPKWLGSSAVFPSEGSPPTIWRLPLWTSGGGVTMRNEPWVWPEVGGAARDERRGSSASEVGTDDGTAKKPHKNKQTKKHLIFLSGYRNSQTSTELSPGRKLAAVAGSKHMKDSKQCNLLGHKRHILVLINSARNTEHWQVPTATLKDMMSRRPTVTLTTWPCVFIHGTD